VFGQEMIRRRREKQRVGGKVKKAHGVRGGGYQ
jgi:hypothetical protein